jgi:hypothetical protein
VQYRDEIFQDGGEKWGQRSIGAEEEGAEGSRKGLEGSEVEVEEEG